MTNPPPPSAIGRESELVVQQSRYAQAHARLMGGLPPSAKPKRARPVSPFAGTAPAMPTQEAPGYTPLWRRIVLEVARKHGFTLAEMQSIRRQKMLCAARHEACYRLVKETSLSLPQIGMKLGGRDHTTVIYGFKKHSKLVVGAQ